MGSEVPVAIYDASVLFPFQTAHILMFVATSRLVRAHWSADIEQEWVERSLEKYEGLQRASIEKCRDLMNRALPDARVEGYEHRIEAIAFPDPDDRHVVAAALQCGAKLVVSRDKKHFNERSLRRYGLSRIDPDDLLVNRLNEEPELVLDAANQARLALIQSAPTWDAYVAMLRKTGLPQFAEALSRHVPKDVPEEEEEEEPVKPTHRPKGA